MLAELRFAMEPGTYCSSHRTPEGHVISPSQWKKYINNNKTQPPFQDWPCKT